MSVRSKLTSLFRREKLDADMAEEMRAHLEMQTLRNVAEGMLPEEARYAAQRQFGGLEQVKETARAQRSWRWLEEGGRDVRFSLRQLAKARGFTLVAIFSIALGIGANTAIFSVINETFLKPLPLPRADELVRFEWAGNIEKIAGSFTDAVRESRTGHHVGAAFTFLSFQDFRQSNQTLQSLFAFATIGGHIAVVDGAAESIGAVDFVSGEYFTGLGVTASRGRVLTTEDDRAAATPAAMISHAFWLRRFGGEATAIGKTIWVNMTPVTIVGVTPPEFRGAKSFGNASTVFLPLVLIDRINPGATNLEAKPGNWWIFGLMGRLKPGVSAVQARENFTPSFQRSVVDGSIASGANALDLTELSALFPRLSVEAGSNGSGLVRLKATQQLRGLFGLMGLMFLIACTNVANLLLARGAARRKEIAVRLALGASRFRIVRQLLAESLLLAMGGGLLGVIFAAAGADLLAAMFPFGGTSHVDLDGRVLGFAITVSTLTGVLFGVVPALRATRIDLAADFQGGQRTVGAARPVLRLSRFLMIVQVALSFVVLTGAGLFIFTLRNLRAAEIGFARDHLLLFHLNAKSAGYKGSQTAALFERVAAEIRLLPGVSDATFSSNPVVGGRGNFGGFNVKGAPASERPPPAAYNEVAPSFFAIYRLPPLLGRTFAASDGGAGSKVIVVNEALATKYFPGENPLGRQIMSDRTELEIVGVVRNIQYEHVRKEVPPTIYFPFVQQPAGNATFAVRTAGEPLAFAASIREVVRKIEPNLPVTDVRTQEEQLERLFGSERMFARLATIFGVSALTLVCVGLYGLMSYAVQRRTSEIGLRMALGAVPAQVLRMVLRESILLVVLGILVGVAGSLAATRLIVSMLFGLSPGDPVTYVAVALLLVVVAMLTCLVPARRAAKVDPMVALRCE